MITSDRFDHREERLGLCKKCSYCVMFILLCKEGPYLNELTKENKLVEFSEYEKYKHLGLVYPYMCIFAENQHKDVPALMMLSYDNKMRLQYKYNSAHLIQTQQDKLKYVKSMIDNLDSAVVQIGRDLRNNENEYIQLLGLMAYITMKTGIRIGKDIHLRKYESVGLSTLMKRNVKCNSNKCEFNFIGKKQVTYKYEINDPICYSILKRKLSECKKENDFIFQTGSRKITYMDFNEYVKQIFKNEFVSGKDFRTLLANVSFLENFKKLEKANPNINTNIKLSVKHVASVLQNTNAVSKKSYIFSTIIDYINSNYDNVIHSNSVIELLQKIFKSIGRN